MNPTEEQIVVTIKSKWRSFTVWFNGVLTLILAADWTAAASNLSNLQAYLPPNTYHALVVFVAVMNILIRVFKTKGPVS